MTMYFCLIKFKGDNISVVLNLFLEELSLNYQIISSLKSVELI